MVKNKIVVCEYSKIVQNVIKSILGKIKEMRDPYLNYAKY